MQSGKCELYQVSGSREQGFGNRKQGAGLHSQRRPTIELHLPTPDRLVELRERAARAVVLRRSHQPGDLTPRPAHEHRSTFQRFGGEGSGFGQGLGLRVWGLGFRVEGAGFRVQGLGFRVWGSGFGVEA